MKPSEVNYDALASLGIALNDDGSNIEVSYEQDPDTDTDTDTDSDDEDY